MNARSFKVIFSKRLGALVAVGENATSQGKSASGETSHSGASALDTLNSAAQYTGMLKALCLATLIGALPKAFALDATALPTGADVRHGSATVGTEGATMTINQSTSRATINWQSFNVGTDARVNVVQNDSHSVLLNRVVGNEMSQIRGQISANGQVVLVNPNGIVMGPTGRITASAFTASTFGISDANFEAGKMKYERNGSTGQIVHQGHIQTAEAGGYVALIGADVNNQGTITTRQGAVVLAAADAVTLPSIGAINNVSVPLSRNVRLEINPAAFGPASVSNSGVIVTEGGQVLLRAAAVVDAISLVAQAKVTHNGTIDTTGSQGGGVDILADKGHVRVSGTVKANSTHGTAGGDVYIGRDKDTNILAAVGDVRGAKLESLGGFIETSGDYLSTRNIQVKAKDWLLDPTNIRIVEPGTTTAASSTTSGANPTTTFNGPSGISDSLVFRDDIQNAINAGTSVTIDTANSTPGADGSGNITIETALSFVNNTTNAATLSLLAKNGITQNSGASITNTGSGLVHVVMVAEGLPRGVAIAAGTNNTSSNGITLNSTIKTNGDVTITGTSANNAQHGVRFSTGSGIDARSYNVTGRMTASSGGSQGAAQGSGVVFTGTSAFKSTADSKITASTSSTGSAGVYGMHFHNGSNVSFDTGNAKLVAATDAANMGNGVKIGWAGGAVINTRGDVTLGSLNANAFTHVQGKINAQGGTLTLLGRSASDGVQFQDGGGIGPEVIGTQGANITIRGESSGGGTGVNTNRFNWGTTVISSSGTSSTNTAGNISITGTSASGTGIINSAVANITNTSTGTSTKGGIKLEGTSNAGNHHGINSAGQITAAGLVEMDGTANGQRSGVRVVAKVEGGSVDIYGSSAGDIGVDVAAMVKSTDASTQGVTLTGFGGNTWQRDNQGVFVRASGAVDSASKVSIVGTNNRFAYWGELMGTKIQGTVLAAGDINLEGHSTGGSSNHGLVINSTVTSIGGDIKTTATNRTSEKVALLISGEGALIAKDGTNQKINMVADTMDFSSATATQAINAGTTGTVNITTKDAAKAIRIGRDDGWPIDPWLNLNQTELNKITAAKTVIGDSNNTGGITVSGAVTTATATGDITLFTKGNIFINAALTVGSASATENLTLNGAGASSAITQNAAGIIKAAGLELLGANATHALNNTGNDIKKLAGDTKTVSLTNNANLAIDTVNTRVGLTTSGNTTLNSTATVTQALGANIKAAGLELLGAGGNYTLINAGNDIKKLAGNTGTVSLTNDQDFAIDTVNTRAGLTTSGNTTLNSTAAVTQTQAIKAAGLELLGTGGSYTLKNSGNTVQSLAGNTGTVSLTNQGNLTVGVVNGRTGLTAANDIELTTTTATGIALFITQNIESTNGNVKINATTSDTSDLSPPLAAVKSQALVKGKDITVNAVALGTTGKTLGYYGAGDGGKFEALNDLKLIASTQNTGSGFYMFRGALSAGNTLTIEGRSALGQGVGFDHPGSLTNVSSEHGITIKGTASNSTSTVPQAAINLKDVNLTNNRSGAVTLEAIKGDIRTLGTGTLTQNGDGGVTLTTVDHGNITVPKIINNGTGNVVIAAGSDLRADNGGGGQVLTLNGNSITQNGNGTEIGKTFIYSGKAASTGELSILDSTLGALKIDGTAAQNVDTNAAFGAGTGISGSNAKAQVIFREKLSFADGTLTDATLTKTYGDANTAQTAANALLVEAKGALKTAAGVNPTVTVGNGTNNILVSKSAIVDTLDDTLTDGAFSTSNFLKADTSGTYKFEGMTSTKYTVTGVDVRVDVKKRDITIAATPTTVTFNGATQTQAARTQTGEFLVGDKVEVTGGSATGTAVGTYNDEISWRAAVADDLSNYNVTRQNAALTIVADTPPIPPGPVVPVPAPAPSNNTVVVAGGNNSFQLAGAEAACSADTLNQCECETATNPEGIALEGIQICYEPNSRPSSAL